jgi:hypothetical protein
MPDAVDGTYDIEIEIDGVEHYLPEGSTHEARSTCPCDPLPARSRGVTGWLHRVMAPPL